MPESEAEVIEGSQISWDSQESLGHSMEDIPKDEVTWMSQAQIYIDSIGCGWGYLNICFIMKLDLKEDNDYLRFHQLVIGYRSRIHTHSSITLHQM